MEPAQSRCQAALDELEHRLSALDPGVLEPVQVPGQGAAEEQEQKLLGMGVRVKNTFLEPVDHGVLGEGVRRANSDPTSSRSSSRNSSCSRSSTGEKDEPPGGAAQASGKGPSSASGSSRPRGDEREQQEAQEERTSEGDWLPAESWQKLVQGAASRNMVLGEVLRSVPREAGQLTSLGSAQHESGQCRPCAYSQVLGSSTDGGVAAAGCVEGIFCRFCHFQHEATARIRIRPSKGRRTKMRQLIQSMAPDISGDPEAHLDPESIDRLPHWIKDNPVLLDRFKAKCSAQAGALVENPSAGLPGWPAPGSGGTPAAAPPGGPAAPYLIPGTGLSVCRFSL